jgi:hypothetical protein
VIAKGPLIMNKINNLLLVAILFGGLGLSFTVLAKYEQKNRVKISSMEDTKAIASVNNFNVTQEEKKDTTQTLTTALPSQPAVPSNVLPTPIQEKKIGFIKVHLPANASVFINNKATYSSGPYRIYDVELVAGKPYKFKVVVSYASGISVSRDIVLIGGEEVVLNFSE